MVGIFKNPIMATGNAQYLFKKYNETSQGVGDKIHRLKYNQCPLTASVIMHGSTEYHQ